eukprot:gb/GECG01002726.1/.p1 GENE.gb/GECG01002726.1/~~gb/GECG01002726.1/.p1  ORF type:complete len:241 (+),score=18.73 gb/GECG01002726.1/:1-723(+)
MIGVFCQTRTLGAYKTPSLIRRYANVSQKWRVPGKRAFRQHANPLSLRFTKPIEPLPWDEIYSSPKKPFHLDIGCASGETVCELALQNPEWNYLGVDVRQTVIQSAKRNREKVPYSNVYFLNANLQYNANSILGTLPGPLSVVTMFHPDPWFKKRHRKRRLITAEFLNLLCHYVSSGAKVHIQTDVPELYEDICDQISKATSKLKRHEEPSRNPFGVRTPREEYCINKGMDIYRVLLEYE